MTEDETVAHARRMLDFALKHQRVVWNAMPLTKHGQALRSMRSRYGTARKAKSVFYALANKRTHCGRGKIGGKKIH